MSVALLLDQGIPRDAAEILRHLVFECTHVGEVGMSASADEEILGLAFGKNAVVVTLGAGLSRNSRGFRRDRSVGDSDSNSGLTRREIADCVRLVCARLDSELIAGSLVTVKSRKTTCHSLPIGHSI